MTKCKYDLSAVILSLMVILLPTLGSGVNKAPVIYASLCAAFLALGYRIYKYKRITVTKTALLLLIISVLSFVMLFHVSDKGSHFSFSCVFLTAAILSMVISDIKENSDRKKVESGARRVIYISALVYGISVLLYQLFIESNFLFGKADFAKGSSAFGAIIMLCGIVAYLRLFYGKKKSLGFYASLVFMSLVFVMTGSLPCYLLAGILFLFLAVEIKHKKAETFCAWLTVVILSIVNIVCAAVMFITKSVEFGGAFRGLVSVFGLGKGGYNAVMAILNGGYKASPPLYLELMEIFGVFGIGIIAITVIRTFFVYYRNRNVQSLLMFLAVVVILLTTSDSFCFALPVISLFYSLCENGKEVRVNSAWYVVCFAPMLFFAYFTTAQIPYFLGNNAVDMGEYGDGAEYYATGAGMELFNSQGWEKAYACAEKAYEYGDLNIARQCEYMEKAIKFNKKNYLYKAYLSDVYTRAGNVKEALNIWEGIIARYDRESLYVEYARKVCDVMEKGNVNLSDMEALYKTISDYAQKCENTDIKFEVNNILTKSQQYYIEKREGKFQEGYFEEYTEHSYEYATDLAEVN